MKKALVFCIGLITLMGVGFVTHLRADDVNKDNCFYMNSLHYTANGMGYWYSKEHGGMETLLNIPYNNLSCKSCHVASCDTCHKSESNGKPIYSIKSAQNNEVCLNCHVRIAAVIKTDASLNQKDVHFSNGMVCSDCHKGMDVHGDGITYTSMRSPGAVHVKCEQCHETVPKIRAHEVHHGKLSCEACHVRQVVSCTSCHINTMLKEKKRVAVPVSQWVFLMNYNGKVTSANMQTFVLPDNKTFMIFAPVFSHSVDKKGRECKDCHATQTVKQIQKGKINLTWFEHGELKHISGVIPVADNVTYHSVFQNYDNGKWTPISATTPDKLQYVGFGTPLTKEQLKMLAKPQK